MWHLPWHSQFVQLAQYCKCENRCQVVSPNVPRASHKRTFLGNWKHRDLAWRADPSSSVSKPRCTEGWWETEQVRDSDTPCRPPTATYKIQSTYQMKQIPKYYCRVQNTTISARTDPYKYSFFPRTICDWNSLSAQSRLQLVPGLSC